MTHRTRQKQLWSPDTRGRWVVIWFRYDFALSGERFSSLSRARRFARRVHGRVIRFHRHQWRPITSHEQDMIASDKWRRAANTVRAMLVSQPIGAILQAMRDVAAP